MPDQSDPRQRAWQRNSNLVNQYMQQGDPIDLGVQQTSALGKNINKIMQASTRSLEQNVRIQTRGINTAIAQATATMNQSLQQMTVVNTKGFNAMFGNLLKSISVTKRAFEDLQKTAGNLSLNRGVKGKAGSSGSGKSKGTAHLLEWGVMDNGTVWKYTDDAKESTPATARIPKSSKKGGGGDGPGDYLKDQAKAHGQELQRAVGEISGALHSIAPGLVAVGGIAAFVGSIVGEVFHLDAAFQDMRKSAGGAMESTNKFQHGLIAMQQATRLSHDELIKLGESFLDVGLPVSELDKDLDKYVTSAGKAVRMFGVQDQVAARYTRTLHDAGMSFAQIDNEFSSVYEQMRNNNATIRDAAEAIAEAGSAWDDYGGSLNKSIGDFREGILNTKGLFRVFNMDAKHTGSILGSLFGDIGKTRRQAALIANGMGISGARAYNMLLESPEKGTSMRMQAGLSRMASAMGANAPALFMNQAQLQGFTGTDEAGETRRQGIYMHQNQLQAKLAEQGLDPELSTKAIQYVRNYAQGHQGMSPQQLIQGAFQQAEQERTSGKKGSLLDAMAQLNKSPTEQFKQLGEEIKNQVVKISTWLTETFWNGIQPMIKTMTEYIPTIGDNTVKVLSFLNNNWGAVSDGMTNLGKVMVAVGDMLAKPMQFVINLINMGLEKLGIKQEAPVSDNGARDMAMALLNAKRAGVLKGMPSLPSSGGMGGPSEDYVPSGMDNNMLAKYRAAQGMKMSGKWDKNMMANAAIVAEAAKKQGANPLEAIAIMLQESGGNAHAHGDKGYYANGKFYSDPNGKDPRSKFTSFGLGQLHKGGMLGKLSPEQAYDPYTNAMRYTENLAIVDKKHSNWSPGVRAAFSQGPANKDAYARSINALMPTATAIMAKLQAGGATGSDPKLLELTAQGNKYLEKIANTQQKNQVSQSQQAQKALGNFNPAATGYQKNLTTSVS